MNGRCLARYLWRIKLGQDKSGAKYYCGLEAWQQYVKWLAVCGHCTSTTSQNYILIASNVHMPLYWNYEFSSVVHSLSKSHSTGFLWPHISDVLVYLGHGKTLAEARILSKFRMCFHHLDLSWTLCFIFTSHFTHLMWSLHSHESHCLSKRFLCCHVKRRFLIFGLERCFPRQRSAGAMSGINFLCLGNPGPKKDRC